MMEMESVRSRLLEILDSIGERQQESREYMAGAFEGDEMYDYHNGRDEALEVTKQQILNLFSEELI